MIGERLIPAVLAGSLLVSATGCRSEESPPPSPSVAPPKGKEIRIIREVGVSPEPLGKTTRILAVGEEVTGICVEISAATSGGETTIIAIRREGERYYSPLLLPGESEPSEVYNVPAKVLAETLPPCGGED